MRDHVLDDMADGGGALWALVTDGVMGGLSAGRLTRETVAGRPALRLTGTVSLANNGGFIQMARDLAPPGSLDATGWQGLCLDVCGNGLSYGLHLRPEGLSRPWQSFRAGFSAGRDWARLTVPFAAFTPHRTEGPPDLARLRRIGLVAIGQAMEADLALARLALYR
jgi:hypothetical protein